MEDLSEADQQHIEKVVAGLGYGAVASIDRIAEGSSTENYIVSTSSSKVLVRYYPKRLVDAGYEFRILTTLHAAGLPVPEQLHFERTRKGTRPFTVMEFFDGKMFLESVQESGDDANSLYRRYVGTLADVHATEWRELYQTVNLPDYASEPFAYSQRILRNRAAEAKELGLVEETSEVLRWMVEHSEAPEVAIGEPVLLHGDYHPLNLIDTGESLKLVDWENVDIGDYRKDLAFAALVIGVIFGKEGEDAVMKAYSDMTGRSEGGIRYYMVTEAFHRVVKFYKIATQSGELEPLTKKFWTYLRQRIEDITSIRLFTGFTP